LVLALAAGALALGLAAGAAYLTGYLPVRAFSSAEWKSPAADGVRLSMLDPLLWTHRLRGMSREQVLALLGPPDPTGYFREWDYVYWLGDERGLFRIDSEWLVLRFGKDDRVSEWAVVRD
jgi:hypothetical protein